MYGWEMVWSLTDRKRAVFVGQTANLRRHELVPWHLPHRGERGGIADAAGGDLLLDHALAQRAPLLLPVLLRRCRHRQDEGQEQRALSAGDLSESGRV